jgi:hypothetical protein
MTVHELKIAAIKIANEILIKGYENSLAKKEIISQLSS